MSKAQNEMSIQEDIKLLRAFAIDVRSWAAFGYGPAIDRVCDALEQQLLENKALGEYVEKRERETWEWIQHGINEKLEVSEQKAQGLQHGWDIVLEDNKNLELKLEAALKENEALKEEDNPHARGRIKFNFDALQAKLEASLRKQDYLDTQLHDQLQVEAEYVVRIFELEKENDALNGHIAGLEANLKRDASMAAMAELEAMCSKLDADNVEINHYNNEIGEMLAERDQRVVELNARLEKCTQVCKDLVESADHPNRKAAADYKDLAVVAARSFLLKLNAEQFMNDNKQLFEDLARQEKLETALEKTNAQYGEALDNLAKTDVHTHDWVQGGMGNPPVCRQCGYEEE